VGKTSGLLLLWCGKHWSYPPHFQLQVRCSRVGQETKFYFPCAGCIAGWTAGFIQLAAMLGQLAGHLAAELGWRARRFVSIRSP